MIPLLPCFKVLPLVYDESLSYYEVLCKLTKMLQELATNIDSNSDTIQNEFKKVYQEILDLKAYVDKQDNALSKRIDLTNEHITEEIEKCHKHCEEYAKRLYYQLLDILNQYQGEMKQWVLGEIAKIPSGIPKQFCITGDPRTSGLQHDYATVMRESQCDFVDCGRWTADYFDAFNTTAYMLDDMNICYYRDTKILNGISPNTKPYINFFVDRTGSLYYSNGYIQFFNDRTNFYINFYVNGEKKEEFEFPLNERPYILLTYKYLRNKEYILPVLVDLFTHKQELYYEYLEPYIIYSKYNEDFFNEITKYYGTESPISADLESL